MSDTRFIIIGILLTFVGFLVLGVFGHDYQAATLESTQFDTCYEYSDNMPPVEINCSIKIFDQIIFFGIVTIFIGSGIIALVKGVKGNWDNKVKPEDMVGPSRNQNEDSDDK